MTLLERRHKRYGDAFFAELLAPRDWDPTSLQLEKKRILFLQSPALIKALFSAADGLGSGANAFLRPFFGERSIFVLENGAHDRHRRAIASALTQDTEQHKLLTRDCIARLLSDLRSERSLFTFMEELASEVNIRYMFGAISDEEIGSLQRWLHDGLDSTSSTMPFLPTLMASFGARSPSRRLRDTVTNVRHFIRLRVDVGLAQAAPSGDFLSRYLEAARTAGLTVDDMCDDIGTLLLTGYISTAAAMSWMFYYVARDQTIRDAVLADCAKSAPPESSRLLQACCKEALRLWPPVPVVMRKAMQKLRILDLDVPENTYLIATIIRTHRRADIFPRPESFDPQRFLQRQYSPFEYLPFGIGARRCIGQMQSLQEMLTALPLALRQATVTGVASKPAKRHLMFIPPPNVKIKPIEPAGEGTPTISPRLSAGRSL